ncbi:maleylpyruvate isomerase family mycothiol-dependent enzyme [Nocardia alni]|uniref:maleylpyruvate isomerase family mycothiol-dependent enzyme n=1 Tax=Nocardia alni TaxID=2815723 RepID=UPI001C2189BE|nr:maleylpyruvate isomerase family mycothiol-dependent enzyme [Nocardia alni]
MDYLAVLRAKLAEFGALIDGPLDLSTRVPGCGDWTFYDLADHLGNGNLWVAVGVREGRGDHHGEPAPREVDRLRGWFDDTAEALVAALSTDPRTPAWTFTSQMPRTVGFWQRRRMHETLMHLWDGQDALGRAASFEPELAADGIAEVFELYAPRMIKHGAAAAPDTAIRIHASDTGGDWIYGPGEPSAELSGPAADLLLGLWGRRSLSDPVLGWSGDRVAGERALSGPLVP